MFRWLALLWLALAALAPTSVAWAQETQPVAPTAEEAEATGPVVEIQEPDLRDPFSWIFAPKSITVPAGTTLTWVNKGVIAHTVAAPDMSWTSELLMQGDKYQRTFDAPGEVPYICGLHPWMTATVVVVAPGEAAPMEAAEAPPAEAAVAGAAMAAEQAEAPASPGEAPSSGPPADVQDYGY